MNGAGAIANILQSEGTDYLFCFPVNALIDACAAVGIRPLVARTERTLVNMADGYSRASNGRRIGVATVQHGPGAENAFAGVAQAFADGSPVLFLPGGNPRGRADVPPNFQAADNYRGVTKWSAQVNGADAEGFAAETKATCPASTPLTRISDNSNRTARPDRAIRFDI